MHTPIFSFDFSMNKPAMACLVNNKLNFYVWPIDIDDVSYSKLADCNVNIKNRILPSTKGLNETNSIYTHVSRASDLADMILEDISDILDENQITDLSDIIVSNEGFSFASKGDQTLNLSGYKYILMKALIDKGFTKLYTYSPITIKKTAGCSKKGMGGKENMINALANEKDNHTLISVMKTDPKLLKKKTSFVMCMDDLADAYWCLKTVVEKENIDCIIR